MGTGRQAGEKLGQWLKSTRLDLYPGKGLCGVVTSDDAGPGDHCAVQALLVAGSVTLGKIPGLTGPQFPHLWDEDPALSRNGKQIGGDQRLGEESGERKVGVAI